MNQLPAHLANLPSSGLAARAADGIGSALPPHISIRGNAFTLVDATGAEQRAQTTYLDVCIADISDVMCKQYYKNAWTPDSNEPPACWSANGIAPSVEAVEPQSARCDTCQWNVRGSATSKLSGTAIKACRDEKWLAVLVPGIAIPVQLRLTPGSFANWRSYVEMFRGRPVDMCHVFTRLQFEQDSNGVLTFTVSPTGYIDPPTADMFLKMKAAKASDVLVGRTDRPRQAALPAPTRQEVVPAGELKEGSGQIQGGTLGQPQGFQAATGQPAQGASPSEQPQQPARRRRRTQEQIAADNAAQGSQPASSEQQAPTAPFSTVQQPAATAPFAQPAANTAAPFGIATNASPPPSDLGSELDKLFGSAPAAGGQGGQ